MNARLNMPRAVLRIAFPAALAVFMLFGFIAAGVTVAPNKAGAACYETKRNQSTGVYETFTIDCKTGAPTTDTAPIPSSGSTESGSQSQQDLFKFINESPDSTGNPENPGAFDIGTSDTGIHGFDEVQGLGSIDTNTITGLTGGASCGGSASGGAGANALGGILGGLSPSSVISCVSGTNCPNVAGNLAGGLAGNALNTLAGQTGISPAVLNTIIRGAQSGNFKQTAINLLGGKAADAILGALGLKGGGAAGAAADAVGSALHLGGANPIGSLIGGGSSVPTKETNEKFLKDVKETRQFTEGLHTKETCTDGIASALAGKITNDWVNTTVKFANEQSITNWQVFASTVDENVFKDVVGGINNPDVKRLLIKTYEEDTAPKRILQSRHAPVGLSPLEEFEAVFVEKTDPTLFAQYVNGYDSFNVQRTAAWDAIKNLGIDGGLRSQVTCLDRAGNPTGETRVELCGGNFRTETHASVIRAQRDDAVAAGQKQVADVDEVTDNVNPFLSRFVQQMFVQGLSNLSRRGSGATPAPSAGGGTFPGSATPGTGAGTLPTDTIGPGADVGAGPSGGAEPPPDNSSYLDQLSNTATDTSINAARALLTRNISGAIRTEESYQGTLGDMVQDVVFAARAFDQVRLCYVGLTQRVSTGISTATALEKANQASSTIAAIFVPQIERRAGELASSELVVGELVRIDGLARRAKTAEELNAASDAFDALLSAGLVHSEADLIFLDNDRAAAAVALQQVADEADNQLAECRQF